MNKKRDRSFYITKFLICLLSCLALAAFLGRHRLQNLILQQSADRNYGEILPMETGANEAVFNPYPFLSVPTCVRKAEDTYFIADCYNNQIIYSEDLHAPLYEWKVLTSDVIQPHTVASDGNVILVDDTEQNRVLVFRKRDGGSGNDPDGQNVSDGTEDSSGFYCSQIFDGIGLRPHFTAYDENTRAFYTLSSMTGELYVFRWDGDFVYLDRKTEIERLKNTYVRSFTIDGDTIWFPSGISLAGESPVVLRCRLKDLKILEEFPVDAMYAGMIEILPAGDEYYITVSTDLAGSQDQAAIVRTKDLSALADGSCDNIYEEYFAGGGTPYYLGKIGDLYYLTEHRLPDHALWQFSITDGQITDVISILP